MTVEEARKAAARALRDPWAAPIRETVVGAVADRATAAPDAIAIVDASGALPYRQLVAQVTAVTGWLLGRGCRPGDVVGVLGPRAAESVLVYLALENIGAVYLPIDPDWPSSRTRLVMHRSGVRHVVDHRRHPGPDRPVTNMPQPVVHVLSNLPSPPASVFRSVRPVRRSCEDAAGAELRCVLHTSGSTGEPKGVLLEHRGVVGHLWAKVRELELTAADTVAFTAPPGFVVSLFQMLAALVVGGTVAILDSGSVAFPRRLLAQVHARSVSVLELVPTLIDRVAADIESGTSAATLPCLRWIVSTGEELHPRIAQRILHALPHVRLLNSYGLTETSDDVAHMRVHNPPGSQHRLALGHPIANASLYVLVQHEAVWRAAADNEPGELFVGGGPVCRGYLDDDATAAAFFQDVFDPLSPTGRLYRTGDRARVHAGQLHYLGRHDRQVQIAGVRTEPVEIEIVLDRHPDIHRSTVASTSGTPAALVAFYIPVSTPPTSASLAAYARAALPQALVPHLWVPVATFPTNSNGKIDHRALASRADELLRETNRAPGTPIPCAKPRHRDS
ncbi:AMP-binding protein [Streptomyces netropsis]|uniref:AMP-binding protein n=1 Tax=Streptomyces netropsis TaxID=55404 RepID=UPI0037BB791D